MKPTRRDGKTANKRSIKDLTLRKTGGVKRGADVTAARDASTGLPTGKRQYGPITLV